MRADRNGEHDEEGHSRSPFVPWDSPPSSRPKISSSTVRPLDQLTLPAVLLSSCTDCDDNDPSSNAVTDDHECDGATTDQDWDDFDANSTTLFPDADCDGENDCTPGRAGQVQTISLVRVCRSAFPMGCTQTQEASGHCLADQSPAHKVTLAGDLVVAQTEITEEQWRTVIESNPLEAQQCRAKCPVTSVSFSETHTEVQEEQIGRIVDRVESVVARVDTRFVTCRDTAAQSLSPAKRQTPRSCPFIGSKQPLRGHALRQRRSPGPTPPRPADR
jgi:hypothetical protein